MPDQIVLAQVAEGLSLISSLEDGWVWGVTSNQPIIVLHPLKGQTPRRLHTKVTDLLDSDYFT